MSALDNPWKPLNKGTTTPFWTTVPLLVFLSTPGMPISRPQTREKLEEEQIRMNFSTVDKTVLIPEGREGAESAASPIKFTDKLQNGADLKIKLQGQSLLWTLGFEVQDREVPDPDFYMPDRQGKRLSESYQMYTTERTPKDNPGVLVKLPNLEKKYGTSMFLMDKRSGHLYVTSIEGYKQIDEKGLLFPSESMIVAGALGGDKGEPVAFMVDSKIQWTPAAESTRAPLKASTGRKEAMEQKEPLTPDQLLEMEQTVLYKKELEEAEEDMIQAYLEKSRLEKEEAEIIKQRALKAQKEFEALEQKRDKNRKINEKMREEVKMEQAVASSSSFIKNLKGRDQQQTALNKAISNFWNTSDVPPEPAPTNIASYPSMESLDEERKEELTEAQYEYYNLKRAVLIEKITVANEIYLTHLQNYKQEDPKTRSQKYLIQFNELLDKLNQQFETVVAMLNLPFEKSLMTYPSLEYVMDIVQQKDLTDKNREFFQELMREVEIKNAIAQIVLSNRLAAIGNSEEEVEVNLQHKEYQKESFRLLRFCRRMIEKKDKEAGYIELEQPEGVPDIKPITEKELDQNLMLNHNR